MCKQKQAAIAAQLSLGRVEYEKNASAIADVQNSALRARLDAEAEAHQTKLKQIQKEFDNQVFVNNELLKQKENAAKSAAQGEVDAEIAKQQNLQTELAKTNALIASKKDSRQGTDLTQVIELTQKRASLESQIAESVSQQKEKQQKADNTPIQQDIEARTALKDKIVQLEKDKNAALNSETTRNARTNSELSTQIAKNEEDATKLAADLRVKVSTGAISQELAAERLLSFAKKTELETQLRNINDNYAERRKIIERDFANTTKFLTDAIAKKQAEADKLPEGSKEFEAAQADITANNTKLINATRTKNSALLLAENNYKVETTKINADISKNQADSAEKENAIALKILERNQKKTLDAVQKAQNERIIQIQQLENKGLIDHTEVEERKTEASKINIAAQLNEERLRLKALQALPRPKNQEKGAELDTQIRASQLKVQDLVKSSLDAELKLYRDHIAVIVGNIKDEDTIRETQLENQSRRGIVTQAQVNEELARRKVSSLEKQFALETKDAGKRIDLALQIEKAKTALLDAEIKTRQEKLEVQNQKLKNQIDEQNQGIKRQGDLYGILTKALEQRNKLQEIARDLDKAGTDYITGQLDVLSSLERSEYRKRQIAEFTESIKLRSLQKQQEFERQSLLNQIEQNRLALEREVIQNRIAQGEKVAAIAGVKADIAIAEADERNKTPAGQAKIAAMRLKLQSEVDGLSLLQAEGGLIYQQFNNQKISAEAQLKQLNLKQQLDELKQEAAFAKSLPPGKQQQAGRVVQGKIFNAFGQETSSDFFNAAIADSRGLAKEKFGTSTNPDILGAIDPELGGILDVVGGKAAAAAIADTKQTFNQQYGNTANITGALTTGVAKTPLQLPGGVQDVQELSNKISREVLEETANQKSELATIQSLINASTSEQEKAHLEKAKLQRESTLDYLSKINPEATAKALLPNTASLTLPTPAERGTFLALENSGKLFNEGIEKLIGFLKDQNSTTAKGSTYNIKVEGGQKSASTTGVGNGVSLENVLNLAKQMAGAY